jgi:hypothetical protein
MRTGNSEREKRLGMEAVETGRLRGAARKARRLNG